jgi:hypothetical protein
MRPDQPHERHDRSQQHKDLDARGRGAWARKKIHVQAMLSARFAANRPVTSRRRAPGTSRTASDRFLDYYRAAWGRSGDYHPYWDIAAVLGGLDEDIDAMPSAADENFLVEVVRRL